MGFSWQEYWSELPFSYSRGSSWPRDSTSISSDSCLGRQILLPLSHLGNLGNIWCYSATESCPTLCRSMDCSMPGFPVFHYQTHVHWVNDAIQPSSVTLFSCLQSFLASGSFPMSQLFISGGQSTGASASVLPMNIQGWVPLGLTGLISLLSKGFSRVFSSTTVWKHQFFWLSAFFMVQLSHPYMTTGKTIALTTGKTIALTRWTSAGKVMSLLFSTLSRFVIAFLPRSKHLLISWLQSLSTVILEPKKIKSVTVSTFPLSICHEVMGLDAMIFIFWMLSFKPAFSVSSFTFIKRLYSSPSLSATEVVSSAYLRLLIFLPAILIPVCVNPAQHFSWSTLHIS